MEKSSSSRSPSILLHFAGAAELSCSFLLFITCGCGRPSEPTALTAETMSPKELSPEMQALADRLQQVSSVVRNSDEFWGHRHRFKDAHFEVDTSNPKLVRRVTMCAKSGAFFPYLDSSDISDLEDYSLRTPTQDEDVLLLKPFAQTITSLDLAKTAITDQSLQTLSQFTSLELLSLSGTELCGDDLKLLTSLTKLRYLNLTESTLGPLQLDFLGELTSLERVELSPSMITDHVLNVLGKLPNLRELNLAESSISDRGMEALTGLKLLEELDLSKTNVTDEAMRHVARLPSLKHLNLGGTKITGVGLVAIGNHPRLERLDLSGTSIDDSGLANLSKLEHLTFVNLRDTHVRGHGINQLRECKELAGVNLPPIPLSAVASINQIKSWTHLGLQVMAEDDSSVLDEAASLTFDDMSRLASLHIESMTPIHVMAVRNCPQLNWLHLKSDVQGSVLTEMQFKRLPVLERLELDGAFQRVVGDAEVDRLTHLNISGTISSEIAQMICKCKSLTTLFLKIKAVTGQPYSVANLATLYKMELARVELETPQASSLVNMIGKMPYLRELTLNGRSLTASEVAPLAQCTRLKELHIGGIDDPNTPLAFLNSMLALEECRLTYCPHIGRVHLNGLRDLRELYVMSSELGELEINGLENLTRVELGGERPELSLGRLVIWDAPALKYLIVLGHKSNLALTEIELADCPVLRGLKLYAPPLAIQSTPCRLKTSGKFLNLVERRLMNLATDRSSLDRLMKSNLKGTDLVQDVQLDELNAN